MPSFIQYRLPAQPRSAYRDNLARTGGELFRPYGSADGITGRLCTCQEVNGIPGYSNTRLGDAAAREFGSELPQSIREKMFEEAVKVYTRDEIKKDSLVSVRYAEHENGTCTIGVTIKSEKTGRQKYYLTISAADKAEADSIKKRIQRSPENFRQYLESYFESGTEG